MLRMSLYGTNKNCNLFHLVFFPKTRGCNWFMTSIINGYSNSIIRMCSASFCLQKSDFCND